VERRQLDRQARGIVSRCEGVPVYTAADDLLEKLTGFHLSGGVLAAMRRPRLPGAEELLRCARRVAVLDGLADSTNVGAVFRSAAALGIDAALVTPTCSDPLLRRSVRVSMGTIFQIPWTRIGGVGDLKKLGFTTVAMALSDGALDIGDPRLARAERLAIVLGSEGYGLSPATIAACDYTARIPMSNNVDSLNVAAASAVAFWELRVSM
jgi:tRNA G18 (ribose-2'-O)-methylase SpoU